MALTADSSATPWGSPIDIDGVPRYRAISWANHDRAGLLVAVRIRVPNAHRDYMGDWWIDPLADGLWNEFLSLMPALIAHGGS